MPAMPQQVMSLLPVTLTFIQNQEYRCSAIRKDSGQFFFSFKEPTAIPCRKKKEVGVPEVGVSEL